MSAAEQLDGVLTNALAYAALGWRVVPIRPGEKRPPMTAWQNAATTDTETITNWWTGLYRGHGLGIATGPESGVWVLDVDVANGKVGDETLADLEDAYGALPETVEAITGSGGRHLFFAWPADIEIRAGAAVRLGDGLDVRGIGGQVVASPTVHANGQRYSWVDGHEPDVMAVADAPGWLLSMCEAPEPVAPTEPATATADDDGPAARFNAATSWPELLGRDGWTLHHVDRDGEQHWTRPGKDRREGTSATVGYKGNDALKVFTSSVPGLEAERAYSRFGYVAATRHGGDRSACAHALIAAGYGRPSEPVDLSWITEVQLATDDEASTEEPPAELSIRWVDDLDRHAMPPEPPVLVEGLLRRGEMCVFGAPRAIGKTWLAYNLAIGLARGEGRFLGHLEVVHQANVLYLQGELDPWGSAVRWKLLTGVASPLPHVAETFDRVRFRTVKRRVTYTGPTTSGTEEYVDAHVDDRLEEAIVAHGIDVVIVDPWAVYLAGAENSNDEVEAVLGALREITLRTGVAWVIIHHITGKAERSSWTEPEDLWRGATRLADWASTRVTVLPHYTEAQYKELGLTRREARRHANVHFLRRSTPTDDFTMRLDSGWWVAWTPDDEPPGTTPLLELARRLHDDGGTWDSYRQAGDALGRSVHTVVQLVADAARAGLVTIEDGPRNSKIIRLADGLDHPWAPRATPPIEARRPRDDRATTARRAVEGDFAQSPAQSESVSDQEERSNEDTRLRDDCATTPRSAFPQVKCGDEPLRDLPPPTEGGPLEGPTPIEGENGAANSAPPSTTPASTVGEQEDGSWLF